MNAKLAAGSVAAMVVGSQMAEPTNGIYLVAGLSAAVEFARTKNVRSAVTVLVISAIWYIAAIINTLPWGRSWAAYHYDSALDFTMNMLHYIFISGG